MRELKYPTFCELFPDICNIKENVVNFTHKELREYKKYFFSLKIGRYRLEAIWNYIWDDIDYDRMIFLVKINNVKR